MIQRLGNKRTTVFGNNNRNRSETMQTKRLRLGEVSMMLSNNSMLGSLDVVNPVAMVRAVLTNGLPDS
jgi:hypothetical protein